MSEQHMHRWHSLEPDKDSPEARKWYCRCGVTAVDMGPYRASIYAFEERFAFNEIAGLDRKADVIPGICGRFVLPSTAWHDRMDRVNP